MNEILYTAGYGFSLVPPDSVTIPDSSDVFLTETKYFPLCTERFLLCYEDRKYFIKKFLAAGDSYVRKMENKVSKCPQIEGIGLKLEKTDVIM